MSDKFNHRLPWLKRYPLLGPVFGLVFVLVLFQAMVHFHSGMSFMTPDTVGFILTQTVVVATGALGMTMIIVSGGIDLSAGSMVALTGVVAGVLLRSGHSTWLAIFVAVLVGALGGLINGGIIARFNMLPFIVTLGSMGAARGLAKWVANNQSVNYNFSVTEGINGLMNTPSVLHAASAPQWWAGKVPDPSDPIPSVTPDWLFNLCTHFMRVAPMHPGELYVPVWMPPIAVLILLALTVIMSIVLNRSVFGRHIFALGSNEDTARLCGLRTKTLKVMVYVLAGVFIGLAGVFDVGRLRQGDPTVAIGLELDIIAAVVIGGASLNGGVGSIWGAIIGALMMTSLRNGTVQMGWPSYIQEIIIGVVIVLAHGVDKLRARGLKG
jgi:ribose transport system permease protein